MITMVFFIVSHSVTSSYFQKFVEKYCNLFVIIARRVKGAGQLQQTGGETHLHG